MKTIVVKFGGTSLASAEQIRKVADIVLADPARRFMVASAPGKRFGDDVKVTDLLDGVIARKFNQVTECGKLLDPLADKLTQVAVVICMTTRYPEILPLTVLCFAKELFQGIGGLILLRGNHIVRGAKWFGKVSTVLFYACMAAIVLWSDVMSPAAFWALVGVVGATMLYAFVRYMYMFIQLRREARREQAVPVETGNEKG